MVIASNIAVLWTGLILGSMQAVGAIDTSIFRARALATDDSTYSSCDTEVEACRADPTCVSYVSADVTDDTAVAECYADVDYTGSCDNFGDALCCILSTEPDCVSNSAVDYFGTCVLSYAAACAFETRGMLVGKGDDFAHLWYERSMVA